MGNQLRTAQENVVARSSGLEPLLRVAHLSKSFPGQRALVDVDLTIDVGEIHGLVGENGSGKSTLIKVLAGYHAPDPGATLKFAGRPLHGRRGLAFVHQDLAVVPTLSTIDNLALGRGFARRRLGGIDWRAERVRAAAAIAEFGGEFDPQVPVGRLSPVERTIVAMARALQDLGDGPSLLVLDEPTAALPEPEVERLFAAIRRVASRGTGVLYVSHHLDEVFELCDRITVLRDGHPVASVSASEVDHDALVRLILGRDLREVYGQPPVPRSDVVMSVSGLSGGTVREVSFDVASGEILGIAGLVGSGRADILGLVFGAVRARRGCVRVGDRVVRPASPRDAIGCGIALVPSDRALKALLPGQSVAHNLTLPRLQPCLRRGRLSRRAEEEDVTRWMERLDVRAPTWDTMIEKLSGGNQQKVVLARWLRTEPAVLLLDEPTQGVDLGAKAAVYHLLARTAAEQVIGIVIASGDSEELAGICDRVLVMRDGVLARELAGEALTADRVSHECLASTSP